MIPKYLLFVGMSVLIALVFPVARHLGGKERRRQYYFLQGITLLGAVIGAKVSVLFGDLHWPWVAINDWHAALWSGRSITGALIFGFVFAEIAKPIMGYTLPPNDRFATLLPFTIAIGRLGCLTAGCCQGMVCDNWLGMPGVDGLPRYPIALLEMGFQISTGALFILMLKRGYLFGRLFSLYLTAYGMFRFVTEFVRDTPKFFGGLSGYQILSLVMIVLGTAFFLKRTIARPENWNGFETPVARTSSTELTHA